MPRVSLWLAALAVCTVSGCAPKGLYYWGHYEDLVYDTYVNPGKADTATQVATLSEDIQKAAANGQAVAPGVHAQLGYMYYLEGNLGAARQEFEAEKALFPESATFIDGLLQRMNRP